MLLGPQWHCRNQDRDEPGSALIMAVGNPGETKRQHLWVTVLSECWRSPDWSHGLLWQRLQAKNGAGPSQTMRQDRCSTLKAEKSDPRENKSVCSSCLIDMVSPLCSFCRAVLDCLLFLALNVFLLRSCFVLCCALFLLPLFKVLIFSS